MLKYMKIFKSLAPFFPAEAQKKGLTETQIGIIFGLFELVLLILSPIFGKYVCLLSVFKFEIDLLLFLIFFL